MHGLRRKTKLLGSVVVEKESSSRGRGIDVFPIVLPPCLGCWNNCHWRSSLANVEVSSVIPSPLFSEFSMTVDLLFMLEKERDKERGGDDL
eukprot:15343326-Ditylum_brightwellii.AAC.1